MAQHGETYREYQRRVPMLLPLPKHRPTRAETVVATAFQPGAE